MPASLRRKTGAQQIGATLVELVVSMVVLAIAMTMLSTQFYDQAVQTVQPMMQIRAAELGQALMDEVLSRAYDETTPVGGVPACSPCTPIGSLGADGETRQFYDDVDDYNTYCDTSAPYQPVSDAFGNLPANFNDFQMSICVGYDGNYNGVMNEADPAEPAAKLIVISIYPPSQGVLGDAITFRAYRSNF